MSQRGKPRVMSVNQIQRLFTDTEEQQETWLRVESDNQDSGFVKADGGQAQSARKDFQMCVAISCKLSRNGYYLFRQLLCVVKAWVTLSPQVLHFIERLLW